MTDLNKLLYLAEIVEPEVLWIIENGSVIDIKSVGATRSPWGVPRIYEPHKPTERGDAQLLKIIFNIEKEILDVDDWCPLFMERWRLALGKNDREEIINLAAEVL